MLLSQSRYTNVYMIVIVFLFIPQAVHYNKEQNLLQLYITGMNRNEKIDQKIIFTKTLDVPVQAPLEISVYDYYVPCM